jgi:hypothetical protein
MYLNHILINHSGQLQSHIYRKNTIRYLMILKDPCHPVEVMYRRLSEQNQ